MKPSTAKTKGAATEQTFVDHLKRWVPHAERRHLSGAADRGDIAGVPGVVFEVKSGGRIDLPRWMAELTTEIVNDGADTGAVIIRPKGKPRADDWWAALPLELYLQLLVDAGWLPPPAD